MERLLNKKWWQKLIIALFIVIMFTSIVAKPVQAMSADILLKPITGLFVGLADALEGVMQKIVLGLDESLIEVKVDEDSSFWANLIVIGAFIVGTAIAIVAAIPSGGSSVIAWVGFVVVAVATVCISLGTYAMIGKKITTLIEKMLSDQVYFPQFALSPYEIFDNKITVLDVNFFNPKHEERVISTETDWVMCREKVWEQCSKHNDDPDKYLESECYLDKFLNLYGIKEDYSNLEPIGDNNWRNYGGSGELHGEYRWTNDGVRYKAWLEIYDYEVGKNLIAVSWMYKLVTTAEGGDEWKSDENFVFPDEIIDKTVDIGKILSIEINSSYNIIAVKQKEFDNMFAFKGDESQINPVKNIVPGISNGTSSGYLREYSWLSSGEGLKSRADKVLNYGEECYFAQVSDPIQPEGKSYSIRLVANFEKCIRRPNDSAITILRSPAYELRTYVSGWYVTLRNLALVALLSILVYIGIRILLSSVASDKAKYKQMLLDWVVALSILFVMHYIMSFSIYIVDSFRDMIDSIQINTETKQAVLEQLKNNNASEGNENEVKLGEAVEIFLLDGDSGEDMQKLVKKAYSSIVEAEGGETEFKSYFFTDSNLDTNATSKDQAKVLIWPAQNFMEQARINYQIKRKNGDENVSMYGYGLIYVILVIYTIIFLFTYMKRVVYMAFLTVIAPLVAVTYPIDKMNDGKAQAFNMWFREYIFNLLIQPLHLLLYSVLIGSAMNFASDNLVYVVMALGFFVPAEKMLRRFFGFEKAQTPGLFGGPAGSALMFSGLQRLMHPKLPHKGLGAGNGKDEKGEEDSKAPRTQKIDETGGFLGEGNEGEANNSWGLSNDTYSPDSGRFNLLNGNGTNDDEDNGRALRFSSNGWGADSNAFGQFSTGNGLTQLGSTQVPRLSVPNSSTLPRRRRVRKAIGRTFRGYRTGLHNRYMAKKAQNGGLLRRGVRLAGGLATATAFTAAAGIAGITSGDLSKAGQYMSAGAVGGYKVGSSLGDKATGGVKNQKDMITNALKEGKKGYQGSDYARKQQEKYIKEFKKNEEYLNALQDRLNVDREKAQKIMDTHAKDYIDNDITNIDDFAAVYQLEQEFGNRDKAIATRHYAMDRLNGQKVKNIDPETKAKYDNMFRQEFIKRGQSEAQANATVNELYNAVNKFHKYRK